MVLNDAAEPNTLNGLFVGNPLCFSDTIVKLADIEVPSMAFARTASLSDVLFMNDARAESVRIIIVDESILGDLLKALPQLKETFPFANIALAFRHVRSAERVLKIARDEPALTDVSLLPMTLSTDSWLSVLRLLICGEKYIPAALALQLKQTSAAPIEMDDADSTDIAREAEDDIHLTERELQVLRAAAEGKQNKIIADELKLSQHTVKLHMHHVIAKLGVHNRTEAAIWYLNRNSLDQGN